jgi:hypothetical protein
MDIEKLDIKAFEPQKPQNPKFANQPHKNQPVPASKSVL